METKPQSESSSPLDHAKNLENTTKRLPLPQEIRDRHPDWPTEQEEQELRKSFMDQIKPQIPSLIDKHVPGRLATENQLSYLSNVLYGIYLFNYITGGKLINESIYPQKTNQQHQRLNPNLLRDWPVIIDRSLGSPETNPDGITQIHLASLINTAPDTILKNDPQLAKMVPADAYSATTSELGIIIGLEEAHHAYVIKAGHPLIDLDIFNPYAETSLIDYESDYGHEFQASSFKANAVRRYLTDLWHNRGYQDFWHKVSQKRRSFFNGQK